MSVVAEVFFDPSLKALLEEAVCDHRAGEFAAAERAYYSVLDKHPGHAEANHHVGVLLVQTGRIEEGISHLKLALDAQPLQSLYQLSYANGLLSAGKTGEAEVILKDLRWKGLENLSDMERPL